MRYIPVLLLLTFALALFRPPASQAEAACTTQTMAAVVQPSIARVYVHDGTDWYTGTAFYIGGSEWVTAEHVVRGATRIVLRSTTMDDVGASLVGARQDVDLAVLSASTPAAVAALSWASHPAIGTVVHVAGYGAGHSGGRSPAITRGIVSEVYSAEGRSYVTTDAPANPGNSGGPLLDTCGDVLGVVQAKLVDEAVEGVAYALSSSSAEGLLPSVRSSTAAAVPEEVAQLRSWVATIFEWWGYYHDTDEDQRRGRITSSAAVENHRNIEATMWDYASEIWAEDFSAYGAACQRALWWTAYTAHRLSIAAGLWALYEEIADSFDMSDQMTHADNWIDIAARQATYHQGDCAAGR